MQINIMSIIKDSNVNGPGLRYTVWGQGCKKGCPNCYQPESWSHLKKNYMDTEDIANDILLFGADGVTFSGGDLMEQPVAFYDLLKKLHNADGTLSKKIPQGIICFTGYTVEEIGELPGEEGEYARKCRSMIDLLIDGRYVDALRHYNSLSGSSNQRLWWLDKSGRGKDIVDASRVDSTFDQEVEVHLSEEEGVVEITGFPSIDPKFLKAMGLKILK